MTLRVGPYDAGSGPEAELTVHDTGPGPAKPGKERGRPRQTAISGAGLGLTIVQAVTDAHGGRLEMWPVPGGHEARLILPLAEEGPL